MKPVRIVLLVALLHCATALAAEGYYRSPALHGDQLAFVAEGDLWIVPVSGGVARRLTTHPAEESQPAFSSNGTQLAFVGAYDGGSDVYVMPSSGGEPRRLSFDGARVFLQGFAPDGDVVYASENISGPTLSRVLRAVDPDTLQTRTIPLMDANEAAFSADGETLFFTRFGAHLNTDNVRDYRGGSMAQLWRWQTGSDAEAVRLAPDAGGGLRQPMWWKDRLYAIGDAGDGANLWSMADDGTDRRELTQHRAFQVRSASLNQGRIAYALGADLRLYDIASGSDQALAIFLQSDFLQRRPRILSKPLDYLRSAQLSTRGDRVALAARGQVAVVGLGELRRIAIDTPPRARVREAVLPGDGKFVYAIVDQEAASEIWRFPADGAPGGKPMTSDGNRHRWRLYPSPDGKQIAHDDKQGRLWLLDLQSGDQRQIDSAPAGDDAYASVVWSADSRRLAVVRSTGVRRLSQLLMIDLADDRTETLTSDRYESFAPAFSPDGQWLYFLSNRTFQATPRSPWGDRNMGPMFDRRTKVYALALQENAEFPFAALDELGKTPPAEEKKRASEDERKVIRNPPIQWPGLADRLFELPLPADNYRALAVNSERLYLLIDDTVPNAKPKLKSAKISPPPVKLEDFASEIAGFQLSADGKQLLLLKPAAEGGSGSIGELQIVDASGKLPEDLKPSTVNLSGWALRVDPVDEWRQQFDDAWRMHQAFSFDSGMRGRDWVEVRQRFLPLVPRLADRLDLDDLLGQMIGELGILHSQVRGGDLRDDPAAPKPAALGARWRQADDGLVIERIYRSDVEVPSERAPLLQPGVDAREGDLLRAVNAQPVRTLADLSLALTAQEGQQLVLTLVRGGVEKKTVVRPISLSRDAQLRYSDWVERSRAQVDAAGDGSIGYLHLRAMGSNDIASFARDFYAQFERDGLIIDVRRNRGGNIDSWIIEKLLRRAWAFWQPSQGSPYWNMQQTFRGHLVVLTDALTYSDGETFAAGVKALGLGPVIGTRTAGAGIWLSDRNRLSDNGIARIAEFGQFDAQGRWLIEGNGVAPDIVVDNLPHASASGSDAQLDAAIAHLRTKLQREPISNPLAEPIPPRGTPAHDGSR